MAGTATAAQRPDGVAANPLRKGLATNRITDPCNVVFFGASGDLMKRMLMPAMWNLRLGEILPANYGIVGFSRSEYSDEKFRAEMRKSVDEFSRSGPAKDQLWDDFAQHVSYVSGDFDDVNCFHKLREQLEKNDRELGTAGNRLFYLSTPPSVFAAIVDQLDAAGLGPKDNKSGWSRIIVEKPFGTDLDSARALQAEVAKVFDEKQVYRIDHYLGKEPVQDIMALRFANVIFEPIWNRRYVDSVQITAAETVGVELRGGYYDNAGALRDMIQNHVMNLLALVAMEPPVSANADAIRDEKYKVLCALRPFERWTARMLQTEVQKVFDEKQVYRIDHYLGKEPVQDIMALRFANVIFEPIWNRRYVDSVQITAAETVGVERRGGYYDNAGALRDMIQNHVMNLLALVAMEPPVSADADSIRDEKFKVLSALRPIEPAPARRGVM